MATTKRDYYEILGVDRDASEAEVKRAFRRLARELHPDVNPDPSAEARFKELAEAYEVLSAPDQRAVYDRHGHDGLRGAGAGASTAGFSSFHDLFSAFFGGDPFGMGGQRGPAPGEDVLVAARVSFVESALGVERDVAVTLDERCGTCDGRGYPADAEVRTCPTCGGRGQVQEAVRSPFGQMLRTSTCGACAGRGATVRERCPDCRGAGLRRARRTVPVSVPAGIADGQRIRLSGRGHHGEPGAPAGDLYVEVRVADDERFHRDGLHVVHTVAVSVADAMLGTTITVPTVDGEAAVEIPAGTQSGHQARLRGKGFPSLQGRGRGDQVVVVGVRIPKVTDEEGRRLVEALGAHVVPADHRDGFLGRIRDAFGAARSEGSRSR